MRLHRLELTAFGPFGERQDVDFDALSESGLFPLRGETGSGTTSILDAMCSVLLGNLPDVRGGTEKGVRSRPAWQRPKPKGGGAPPRPKPRSPSRNLMGGPEQGRPSRGRGATQGGTSARAGAG